MEIRRGRCVAGPPEEIYVKAGEMVVLQCQRSSHRLDHAPVIWTSESKLPMDLSNMSPAEQRQMGLLFFDTSLFILTASVNHQGNYSCSQRNESEKLWFRLTVYTTLTTELEHKTWYRMICYTQESCTLSCSDVNIPPSNNPYFTSYDIIWHKEGKSAQKVKSYFSSVEETDSGVYTCTRPYLFDGQIYNMSHTLELDVQPSQRNKHAMISYPGANEIIYVDVGSPAVIKCEAVSYSEPSLMFWMSGKTFVEKNDSFPVFSNYTRENLIEGVKNTVNLVFKEVTEEDLSNNYTCKMQYFPLSIFVTITLAKKVQGSHLPVALCPVVIMAIMAATVSVYVKFKIELILFLRNTLGCHRKTSGPRTTTIQQNYRVVEGEMFLMPCTNNKVTWHKMRAERGENGDFFFDCGTEFLTQANHSGNYTLLNGTMFLYLQVMDKHRLPCYKDEEAVVTLIARAGGTIPCPGFNCTLSTSVTWYKVRQRQTYSRFDVTETPGCSFSQGDKSISKMHRANCVRNGGLQLCTVSQHDTGRYFCDKHFVEQGVQWTFRRPVAVTAIPFEKVSASPRITLPDDSAPQEVELEERHTLSCLVHFPFEVNFSPQVQWYMNEGDEGGKRNLMQTESQRCNRVTFEEYLVTTKALIQQVTALHLKHTYTCMASNSAGNSSVTVKLKMKTKEKWPSLISYPIASLLLLAGVAIVLRVKWLELQLIYISRLQSEKVDADEKEFDVFFSYVWTSPHYEAAGLTRSAQSSPNSHDSPSTFEPFNLEHVIDNLRPPEVVIPMVLEDLWGYRLCLTERDMLPGGAYTNDVVHAIRRSQILICVVSADYLSNSNAVFVLESGIQVLLQSSTLKILLIRTSRTSACFEQLDSPLPSVVQRALKVLPSLDWNLGQTESATGNFWRSLKKALPKHRVRSVTRVISHDPFGNDLRDQDLRIEMH
ncbi:interleukin-18 receptor accessory protein isoform X2 [Syngnathus scovelli]|uniref:interleukin-18 receptor accessory protein isoform X2 n=1 Tax=Syngnathus scovelli TaxID=161590 RepID=UPI00211025BA|nr:interleukin-18 receptor accessory protein isoform X2 [Syngnathus scovelli]